MALSKNSLDNEICEIIEGLYLSSLKAALFKNKIRNLKITHVLSVM